MADAKRHDAEETDDDHDQPEKISNTVRAAGVTGLIQAGVIHGDVHHYPPAPPPPVAVPRQLAAAPTGFVGRVDHLAALDRALTSTLDGREATATAVISAIGGTGGIGKTWLALTWANRNLHRFPDGQLSVDLRGFSPGDPKHAADALADFLAALGVDRRRQPVDLDARAALYRTHTAGKHLLILLDNAATADQVVPLLPGGSSCTVLITSRNLLPALLTRHGARPVNVDVLTDAEASTLLGSALGDAEAAGERAVSELIALCGGFPLALGLVTARIRTRPELVHDIVSELRELGLSALDSDDPGASLPKVLSWSLRHLTSRQRTGFALLGIAPGPDIDVPAAASLTGLSKRDALALLRGLVDVSLLSQAPGSRYSMHDLVRDYAAATADEHVPEPDQCAALERAVDFYLHTAHTASGFLNPSRAGMALNPPVPDVCPEPLADRPAALAWLATHHAHLLAAQNAAAAHSHHQVAWALAGTLSDFHQMQGHSQEDLAVSQIAFEASVHLDDPAIRSSAHRLLAQAQARLGQHESAVDHLRQALALAEQHDIAAEQAHANHYLAWTWIRQGDARQAMDHARRAMDLYLALGQQVWEAYALDMVGWCAAHLGDYDMARDHAEAALTLHRRHHNVGGEAATLDTLANIDTHAGRHRQAIDRYQQALMIRRTLGNVSGTANTLNSLGRPHVALGEHEQARAVWREALELFRQQGRDADAERVQRQLDELEASALQGGDQPID